ncbi:MAG: isoaspartyl peptidase/L-asparaginase [Nitrososphaeraceae archaeon]
MDGRDISAGSVGMVTGIKNPIKLARQIMERTDHVMIVSGQLNFQSYLTALLKIILMS